MGVIEGTTILVRKYQLEILKEVEEKSREAKIERSDKIKEVTQLSANMKQAIIQNRDILWYFSHEIDRMRINELEKEELERVETEIGSNLATKSLIISVAKQFQMCGQQVWSQFANYL